METIILVIHLILAIGIVATVLLQRSEGGGLGIGGGGGGLMSVRSAANLMTRTTAILATAFMVTSLTLAILAGMRTDRKSILERPAATTTPVEQQTPAKPKVPLSQ